MRKLSLFMLVVLIVLSLMGCATVDKEETSTVAVTGTSSVSVIPDSASFTITAESTAETTEEARNTSSLMIQSAVNILKDEFELSGDEISTDYMNINPSYEWIDGKRTLAGQRASQSLTIVLKNGLERVGKVYDRLSILDGISISSISYSKLDTSLEEAEARKMAAGAALKKASDYADGVNMKVGKVLSLSEGSVSYSYYAPANSKVMLTEASSDSYYSTTYYQGDLSVSATVTAVFTLE